MSEASIQSQAVDAWMLRVLTRAPADKRLKLFQSALKALWDAAFLTLGEITLVVIGERVLHVGKTAYPLLAAATVNADGFELATLVGYTTNNPDLEPAFRFLLIEFLTIMDKLTAGVISPRLYASLNEISAAETASVVLEIVLIPQPDVSIEEHLEMKHETLRKFPYASGQLSRFGVEEIVADGVFLLTIEAVGDERQRYFEIHKLRNTQHALGRHRMKIAKGGVIISNRGHTATGRDQKQ